MLPRILLWSSTMAFVASPDLIAFGYKVAASAAVGVIMAVVLWPFMKIKSEWKTMKEEQGKIHSELVQQRENHLTHIEQYGKTQTELLSKMCDVLGGVRLDLREQTVILRMPCPRVRTRVAKKKN